MRSSQVTHCWLMTYTRCNAECLVCLRKGHHFKISLLGSFDLCRRGKKWLWHFKYLAFSEILQAWCQFIFKLQNNEHGWSDCGVHSHLKFMLHGVCLTFLRPENIYEGVASTVDTVLRFYRLLWGRQFDALLLDGICVFRASRTVF